MRIKISLHISRQLCTNTLPTKKNGLICFTINEGIYKDYGFDKKIENLKQDNKWDELEFFKSDYIASKDVNAWLGLYRVK